MADEEVDSVEINEDSMYVKHLSGEEVDMEMSETAPVFDEKGEKEAKKRKRRLTSKVGRLFDPEKFRELFTAAAIMHDLPFQFTEWAGIRAIFHHLHGDLHLVNRNTCEADCLKMFKRESSDEYMRIMATKMHEKFDKYWADFSTILAIAVSLDPRFKFVFVEWCYKKLYGDDGISRAMLVKNKLFSLFYEYSNGNTFSSSSPSSSNIVNKNAAPSSNESPFLEENETS